MKRTAILGILAALMMAGSVLSASCGGGSDGIPGGVAAIFTPAQSPAPNSVSMQKGTVNGDVFQIEIRVTDVVDFFGAAFHVEWNPATVTFMSASSASSVLGASTLCDQEGGACFLFDEVAAGDLEVSAGLVQNQAGSVSGFTGSGLLVMLTFRATTSIPPPGNAFSFSDEEACNSQLDPPPGDGCTQIAVTWHGGTLTTN